MRSRSCSKGFGARGKFSWRNRISRRSGGGVLFYLREVFPPALARLDERLQQAWKINGFAPAPLEDPHVWPKLRFGTWVGGDRDGHPLVTAEVTRETLRELRLHALLVMRRQLEDLATNLPLSSNFQQSPPALDRALVDLWSENPELAEVLARQHSDEPWHQFVMLLQAKLPLTHTAGEDVSLEERSRHYKSPLELDAHLAELSASLYAVGAGRLADTAVLPVRRTLEVFGFHLAALDIRQNSRFHDLAMDQLLAASGAGETKFSDWSEDVRLAFLNRELASPRPFLGAGVSAGDHADTVLSCYSVLRSHILCHGREGVGSLIVSMTRRLSDLLAVYILAREAGLARWTPDGLVCELPLVPLFETLEDLENGPEIVRAFLAHPVTARSLLFQQSERMQVLSVRQSRPVQQVMIGYSDSNKDCGIFASQWTLHQSQSALSKAGTEAGTKIRFFHGRGGTISRGAGPTHRFLDALPQGSVQADLRLTEQGETIPQKYSNLVSAVYNLELLQAGVAGVSLKQRVSEPDPEFDATRSMLAAIFGGTIESRRPRMLKTLALRDATLRTLHIHQIELLKKWRSARSENPHEAEILLPEVLISINAIASGLRTTG